LGVDQAVPRYQSHGRSRDRISNTATEWDRARKAAHAQYQGPWRAFRAARYSGDVLGVVLTIGIGSHNCVKLRELDERAIDPGLQSRSFAQVHRVPQNPHARENGRSFEDSAEVRATAIVYNVKSSEGCSAGRTENVHQVRARTIRRDHQDEPSLHKHTV
jgi:hypothetical protein